MCMFKNWITRIKQSYVTLQQFLPKSSFLNVPKMSAGEIKEIISHSLDMDSRVLQQSQMKVLIIETVLLSIFI